MPSILVYTDPAKPGICELPTFVDGDDQNWSLQFSNGVNLYNPTGVLMRLGYMVGLDNLTFANGFEWIDRMNNRHIASFVIAAGVPGSLTWDDNPIDVQGGNGCWLVKGRTPPSSQLRKVNVIFGGSGLSTAPRVDFNGGGLTQSGKGATGTAAITSTAVSSVTVTNPGHNYSVPPFILIGGDGTGAQARAVLTNGQVTSVVVLAGGSGYSSTTVTFIDPEASATATVAGSAAIAQIVLAAGGANYTSAPTIGFSGGGGSSAAATAALLNSTWGLRTITLTNPGSGFTAPPTVGFSGGTGTGATAVATISPSGSIASIGVDTPGRYLSGNSGPPTVLVSLAGGAGSGVTAQAVMQTYEEGGPWYIAQILIFNAGGGYTSTPTVSLLAATGVTVVTAATATAVVATGVVTSVVLTNPGSGYGATAPTIAFTGGGGTGAAATAVVLGSPVGSLTLTNAGSGYTSPPVMAFSGGAGAGAAANAFLTATLGITAITLVQPGFAYTSLPSVTLLPGGNAVLEPAGIETNPTPYVRNQNPAFTAGGVVAIPYSHGRINSAGELAYDDSLLIIRPRTVLNPTLTLQGDALTWAGYFTPVTQFVAAVLGFRRSCVLDLEIFGAGRLLYGGKLIVLRKFN